VVDRDPTGGCGAALAFRRARRSQVLALVANQEIRVGRSRRASSSACVNSRSPTTLRDVQAALVYLRRYPEAISAGEAALSLQPANLRLIQWQVVSYVASGDLAGARNVVRSAITAGVSAPEIAAYFGGYFEMAWTLDEPEQLLLFRLTPGAFDDDRAWWGQSIATGTGPAASTARAYADSAERLGGATRTTDPLRRSTP
jgi:hypothetical protein